MRKLPVIIATACTLASIVPALAESQSYMSERGERMGGNMGERRTYGEYNEGHHRHGWRGMQEGCKYITVRQRQGDEVTIKHFKRCD